MGCSATPPNTITGSTNVGGSVSESFTANGTPGGYLVSASASGLSTATFSLTNTYIPVATTYTITPLVSSSYVGQPVSVAVATLDQFGVADASYSGTANITSTDPAASFTTPVTFTSGTASFNVTFNTVGASQTVTVTDTGNSALTATTSGVNVTIPNYVVTTNQDDDGSLASTSCTVQTTPGTGTNGACSLRDALIDAGTAGSGNITFDSTQFASAQTILLSNGTLPVGSNVSIMGPTSGTGASTQNLVTVDGGGAANNAPVFSVSASAVNASIANLAITDGVLNFNAAGGITMGYGATLTVINSTISGNSAPSGNGAIFNDYTATLNVIGSTVSNNSGGGAAIVNESGGTVSVTNSTMSGNSSIGSGGAISNLGGTVTVAGSTISGNSSTSDAGGILNSGGTLTLSNTIVSGNSAPANTDIDGTVVDNGGNQIGTAVNLAPLGNNGGPTQTMLPLSGSSAICTGTLANATAAGITADQRGFPFNPSCPTGAIDAGSAQTGAVIFSANSISFGSTTVNTWSASQWITMVNKGSAPLSIGSVSVTGVNADQFVIASTCGTTLAPQASCFIHGHFQPTATGPATAAVTITDSDSSSPQTIALSGTGVAPAGAITLQMSSLNFSSINVGSSSGAQSVTVTNTGAAVVNIGSIAVTGTNASEFAFANNCGSSLAIGASCIIHGHFAPTAIGAASAAVTITDDAAGSPQTITLSGTGVASSVTLSAGSLAYGTVTVNTVAESQSVTLTNSGNAILSIGSIAVSGANASDFVFANDCGTSLAVGASCTIHGHFAPTTTTAETAAVIITDNAAGSPQSIALTGTGAAATSPLTFSSPSLPAGSTPTNLNFGSVDMGATSVSQSVIMTNTGAAVVNISSIAVTGANSSQFVFGNNCGATLAVGASCVIQGHFAPTGTGPMSAAVTVTDDAAGSPQSIALSGTGVTQQLTLSATNLWFGTVTVGASSVSESVTMTNVGTGALAITSIAVTGNNPTSFVFANNCGTSLAIGASCTIHGHFAPTATGPLNATITITDSASSSPQTISLGGTGQ